MYLLRSFFASTLVVLLSGSQAALAAQPAGSGTGFLVSKDGWVVTNAHVVEGCSYVEVSSFSKATDIQIDKQNDLAVMRVTALPDTIQPLILRNTSPRLGEDVAALGYPLSQILSDSIKITMGNINSLIGLENDTRYLQISTPIQPGNSGGPLVDRGGFLLGINSARLNDNYAIQHSGSIPQNVNFAIKSNILELFLQSRNINFEKDGDSNSPQLSSADLADKISKSVFQILCFSDEKTKTVAASSAETNIPVEKTYPSPGIKDTDNQYLHNAAGDFVKLMINNSDDSLTALRIADRLYADYVEFFGKMRTHNEVLQDKRNYFARWPVRSSYLNESSMQVICESNKCAVTGEYDWRVRSPKRNKQANGTATFYYVLDMKAGGKVIAEGGKARK